MTVGGFAGSVLYVDLTHGKIEKGPLDLALAEQFIGGFGLTVKLAYDTIKPGTDALSPDNPIVGGRAPGGDEPSVHLQALRGYETAF